MNKSVNVVNEGLFPTFEDVLREIDVVIQDSDYSGDNDNHYGIKQTFGKRGQKA